jgi:hypothetical protein
MRWFARGLVFAATLGMLSLSGCGAGSSASPPNDLTVTAGDGQVTLNWTADSSVQYWVYYAPASSISVDNWTTIVGARALMNVSPPLVINGLVNGTTYAFTMDGRVNNGPRGSGSPSVTAVPRPAGGIWTVGASLGAQDLNAATYGAVGGNIFVVVGAGGKIVTSLDGITWTTLSNTASTADLNAVAFGGASYVAAGSGGAILYSTDGITWASDVSPTSNALLGLTTNGASAFVGVGAAGTIVYSADGVNWSTATSGTTNDLLAVAYGNGLYVAVGTSGTLLTSTDGVTWTAESSNTSLNLRSIAYGINAATSTSLFVAVGASGALVASTDGVTWTSYGSLPVANINSIIYGTQFVLVGDSGIIYTSTTGTAWQTQSSGTTNNLKAVARSTYSYSAVGASGTNLSAM